MARSTRRATTATLAIFAAGLLTVTACSLPKAAEQDSLITLHVDIFGGAGFGYEKLYPEYEKAHPNIKIVERGYGRNLTDLEKQITQWFKSGGGAGDIVALEEGTVAKAVAENENFVNLLDYGAGARRAEFMDWKWSQASTPDGKRVIGLGTDIGGMAMCYRKDLFAKAGLPTDRTAVAALWPDWNAFMTTGRRFKAAKTGASFNDSATNLFATMLLQTAGKSSGYTFYDKSGKLVLNENPDVKTAWKMATKVITAGLDAGVAPWSDEWRDGFKNPRFATVTCPAWMTGLIKEAAGEDMAGKWDIAKSPGKGGNWGGSFLAVPTQSRHPREAADLASFLTSAHGQVVAFQSTGNLPSNLKALDDPAVRDAKNAFFSNAPTGQIFAAGARELKPVYMGPYNQVVREEMETAMHNVALGRDSAEAGWRKAVAAATAADKKVAG